MKHNPSALNPTQPPSTTHSVAGDGNLIATALLVQVDRELMTLWYRAPELLMGRDSIDASVDSWGAGAVVLEMLVGKPPFRGDPTAGCKCSSVLHENFNADQLAKIFEVVGSPTVPSPSLPLPAPHCFPSPPWPRLAYLVPSSPDSCPKTWTIHR